MTKKLVFPTEEWVLEFWELLKVNNAYKEAAKTWEGDFFFEVIADGEAITEDIRLYMDLWHGECRLARMAELDDNPEFIYSGTLANWKRLIAGEIDPIKGLMSRKFKLPTGDMGKIMRATKAAAELVSTAQKVPTRYIDE